MLIKSSKLFIAMLLTAALIVMPITEISTYANTSIHRVANVVVFAYFNDVDPDRLEHFYEKSTADALIKMYNGTEVMDFKGYMTEISYGRLEVVNIFPQQQADGTFTALALPFSKESTRGAFIEGDIIKYINSALPAIHSDMDLNDDGVLDSLNIVYIDDASSITDFPTVWPHQHTNQNETITFNGLKVIKTHVENTDVLYSLPDEFSLVDGAGVIAHEFLHVLGYPDLYDGYDAIGGYTPVGAVDIMAVVSEYLQWPLAYMRQRFSGWVELPIITTSETGVKVDLQKNRDGTQGVIIKSPLNDYEFFVVEFRQDTDHNETPTQLDSRLYDSGLLIYRINTNVTNLSNFFGQTGVYVFRDPTPDHYNLMMDMFFSGDADTDLDQRQLGSADMSHGESDGAITFDDGRNSGIIIDNISVSTGSSMTFDVTIPQAEEFDFWSDTDYINTASDNKAVAIVNYNDSLYSVTSVESKGELANNFNLYRYNSDSIWERVSGFDDNNINFTADMQLFVFNGSIHIAYSTLSGEVHLTHIKRYNNETGRWIDVKTLNDDNHSGGFDVTTQGNEIYISYVSGDYPNYSLKLARVTADDITTVIGEAGLAGQPKVSASGDRVFVSAVVGKTVLTREVFADSGMISIDYTASDTLVVSYDMVGHENNLYMVIEEGGTMNLKRLSSGEWETVARKDGNYFAPKIQSSQGNLYLLAGSNTGDGTTEVFRFINDNTLSSEERLEMEGEPVDKRSSKPTIESIGGALYVSYVKTSDNSTIIKEKITSNQLIAISVNTPPTVTSYIAGETVSYAGLKINANYEKEIRVVENGYTVTGFDTTIEGERYATVTYEGKTTTFPYFVQSKINPDEYLPDIFGRVSSINTSVATVSLYNTTDTDFSDAVHTTAFSSAQSQDGAVGSFSIHNIANGEYNMVISKPSHLDYIINGITIYDASINFADSENDKINSINLIPGDVNNDNIINFTDLAVIRNGSNFQKNIDTAVNPHADIDNNGIIDVADIRLITQGGNYNQNVDICTVNY